MPTFSNTGATRLSRREQQRRVYSKAYELFSLAETTTDPHRKARLKAAGERLWAKHLELSSDRN